MICENTLIIYGDADKLMQIDFEFEKISEYNLFSEFVLDRLMNCFAHKTKELKNLEFVKEALEGVEDVEHIPLQILMDLFGTRWVDITTMDAEYGERKLTITFESNLTPPLAIAPIIAQGFEVRAYMESTESYSDNAYTIDAESLVDYDATYYNYYEFMYKVKNDYKVLENILPFYNSFETLEEDIEKENIFLKPKELLWLHEAFKGVKTSIL